jgi:biopolymer transport protein ExbD
MSMDMGTGGGPKSEINVTPLVDVVLVLLIIFMVMTPILLKQMEVNVPQKTDVDIAPPVTSEQVVMRIEADGKLSINHEPVAPEVLSERVKTIFAARREKVLFFDVDDRANYGLVVSVMDTCRGAGVKVLGIMTRS